MSKIIINKTCKEYLKYILTSDISANVTLKFEKIHKKVKVCLDELCIFPHVIDDIIINYCNSEFTLKCYIDNYSKNIVDINILYDNGDCLRKTNGDYCNFEITEYNQAYLQNNGSSIYNVLHVMNKKYDMINFFNYYMKTNYNKKKYINVDTQISKYYSEYIRKNKSFENNIYTVKTKNLIRGNYNIFCGTNTYTILNYKKLKNIIVIFKIFIDIVRKNV